MNKTFGNSTPRYDTKSNALAISFSYSLHKKTTYDIKIAWSLSALVIISVLREMIFLVLFLIASAALFAYWFRYSCLLILRTRTAENFGRRVSRANGLSFDKVRVEIDQAPGRDFEKLYSSLEEDYRILAGLLVGVAATIPKESRWEMNLLRVNFFVTKCQFLLSRNLGIGDARQALEEMAATVEHFANTFGEQTESRAMA